MASTQTVPPGLKPIGPYLARATELAKAEPAIGYWCTYYALQQAIAIGSKEQEDTTFLLSLMDKLEEMKADLSSDETVTDDTAASAYVESFALKIFGVADKEDRAGKATRQTAKKFLAAANFLELLSIFGEIESENRDKIKYSKWKATDIAKAFREGRVPVPGPAGGLAEEEQDVVPADQVTGDEEAQLAKELATLDSAAASSGIMKRDASDNSNDEGYPFPSHPTSEPSASASALPHLGDEDEHPVTPAFPSFLNTPIHEPSTPSPEESVPGSATPSSLPPTHQTMSLAPPSDPSGAPFAAAVFPSAPPLYHAPSVEAPSSTFGSPLSPPQTPLPPLTPSQQPPTQPQPPQMPRFAPTPPALLSPMPVPSAPPALVPVQFLDPTAVAKVQKHAKWAISALNYDDLETARKELRMALDMLGG